MSIQSTQNISRKEAIERIQLVHSYIVGKQYRQLEARSSESDYNIAKFIDSEDTMIHNIDNWTNTMIEDLLNCPFYRHSMYDNYIIDED